MTELTISEPSRLPSTADDGCFTSEKQSLISDLGETSTNPKKGPSFLLMQVDGDISIVRIHFETNNDSLILLKATLLVTCLLLLILFLYVVITQDIIPLLRNPSSFLVLLNFRTVVSFVMIIWFIAFCLLSHLVRLNFDLAPEGELFFADIRKELPKCNVCVLPGGEVSMLVLDPEKSQPAERKDSVTSQERKEVRTALLADEDSEAIELREVERYPS
ncbi:hypothetical protein K493DRAFT_310637 [Basidiobolus meristosporus CBS 931.73]|uniref:Uncharacterized protein n=1 Tax=Basidiobolus meristosporus CBS 931.73 TaxID=1314790 RepID=A0A1Y1Z7W8_9FUNG|nr:hypothetical protein K493DRAFT_310637 [Basidiobolus meristosporus CBS 931.73]|eukprot:ORY06306.1 hypothetical protein K493DRAFT_310637 [Basidiobolus meristosporus CBS 931.73]